MPPFSNRVYSGLVVLGAVAALAFLLNEGRNTPIFLLVLFIGWVLLPFGGLLIALRFSSRWPSIARNVLFWLIPIISGGSIASYGVLLMSTETKPAAIFLVVPLASWVLMGVVTAMALLFSRRRQ